MRFIETGPSLPDDLLFAQDEEQVVFFCGSGVSRERAGLPDFTGLASRVLAALGATDESAAKRIFEVLNVVEREHSVRLLYPTDRIFNLLARSFDLANINRAVAATLKPPENVDLSAHRTLLKLAKLRGGQTRLITTNFDLLFEACNRKVGSHTRSDLPRIQFTDNHWGIVHLHGRVNRDYTGPDRDGFILSSAEFGGAYLAQGWARDFIREVLDRHIAVFVGYSADDPPISYLLEGIRQTGGHKHKLYAFQVGGDEEALTLWTEKGVTPIEYSVVGTDHSNLWRTLSAWANRTADPPAWRRKVFAMAKNGPSKLAPYQRGMVAHLVNSASGAQALANFDPPPPAEWLCVFDPLVRFARPSREGGSFRSGEIVDPQTVYGLDDDPPRPGRNETLSSSEPFPKNAWSAFKANTTDRIVESDWYISAVRGRLAHQLPRLPQRLEWLGRWLAKVAEQPTAAWWAGQQYALHRDIIKQIRWRLVDLKETERHAEVVKAWFLIFEYNDLFAVDETSDRYEFQRGVGRHGWSRAAVREYARVFAPRLKLAPLYAGLLPPQGKKISRRDIVRLDVEYPKAPPELVVPDAYLPALLAAQRINLELASDLEQDYSV